MAMNNDWTAELAHVANHFVEGAMILILAYLFMSAMSEDADCYSPQGRLDRAVQTSFRTGEDNRLGNLTITRIAPNHVSIIRDTGARDDR
jgi:hypothetical protein